MMGLPNFDKKAANTKSTTQNVPLKTALKLSHGTPRESHKKIGKIYAEVRMSLQLEESELINSKALQVVTGTEMPILTN